VRLPTRFALNSGFSKDAQTDTVKDSIVRPLRLMRVEEPLMAKPHRTHKKANHGKRPANARARRAKRRKVRT
jgi:hypothetical protein